MPISKVESLIRDGCSLYTAQLFGLIRKAIYRKNSLIYPACHYLHFLAFSLNILVHQPETGLEKGYCVREKIKENSRV